MALDPNILIEVAGTSLGGCNSNIDPSLIGESQFAWGKNIVTRGGFWDTRPGIHYKFELPTGKIQGASYYYLNDGFLTCSIDGRIYKISIDGDDFSLSEITPIVQLYDTSNNLLENIAPYIQPLVGDTVDITTNGTIEIRLGDIIILGENNLYFVTEILSSVSYRSRNLGKDGCVNPGVIVPANLQIQRVDRNSAIRNYVNFCQAGSHLIIQDGESKPIIFNGGSSSRATSSQVPVGDISVFGNGRVWVSRNDSVYAGDIYGITPDGHLYFTENEYLSEGGSFVMPSKITAMAFLPRLDSTTDTGDLFVLTKDSTTAIKATVFDRTLWKSTAGMQKLYFPAIGCEGQRSLSMMNQDLFMRSEDGIRSLRNTASDLQDNGVTPLSREVDRIIGNDSKEWMGYSSSIYFDNRLLVSGNFKRVEFDSDYWSGVRGYNIVSRSIISLDFAPISSMGREGNPIYDGEWTGLNVSQFVKGRFQGKMRCFAFCADNDGKNRLYEITRDESFDRFNEDIRIPCEVEFRAMNFKSPLQDKKLRGAHVYFDKIKGNVDYTIEYKEEKHPCWREWQTGNFCAQYQDCNKSSTQCAPNTYSFGYEKKKTGRPPALCDSFSGRATDVGTQFQMKVSWSGRARLYRMKAMADLKEQDERGEC